MGIEPEDLLEGIDDDEDIAQPQPDTSVIRDLRRKLREAQGKVKASEQSQSELVALREYKQQVETTQRTQQASDVFAQAGIAPKLAPLFLKEHEGEINEVAAREWATNYGILPPPEPEQPPTFSPTLAGAPPSPPMLTRSQLDDLLRTDPQKGYEAMDQGRVDFAQS